jgi:hypothetical protein
MAGRLIIVTSAITMLEMLSSQMSGGHKDAFGRIFSDPNLQMVDLDRRVAGKAAAIRSHYDDRKYKPDGSVSSGGIMGMGDAIHLATAIHFRGSGISDTRRFRQEQTEIRPFEAGRKRSWCSALHKNAEVCPTAGAAKRSRIFSGGISDGIIREK